MVIWITGLAGAGKTTVAHEVARELRAAGTSLVLLDGDEVREAVADPRTGHDPESRLANAYRICRLARMLERQGLCVVVSTMSLFNEVHAWNRKHYSDYFEVLLEVSLGELERRDQKGLYSGAREGRDRNVVGVDLEAELPQDPDLVLKHAARSTSPGELAREIVRACERRRG